MTKYVAYDYEHQQWVEGEIARHLLIEQAQELLALLKSERGKEYVSFAFPANCLEELIEQTENDLLRLKRKPNMKPLVEALSNLKSQFGGAK